MRLDVALILLGLTHSQGFFFPISRPPGLPAIASPHAVTSLRSSGLGKPERRRAVAPVNAAGEGMGGGLSGAKGGRGGAGKGKKGSKKKKKGSKQGTLIPGPPRLENVPEDKLDQAYVFRQERPGQ